MCNIKKRTAMWIRISVGVAAAVFILPLLSGIDRSVQAAEKARYLMGSTRTISSSYPQCVAQGEVINKYAPGVAVTVVETGASLDNLQRLRTGDIGIGSCITNDGAAMSYKGFGKFDTPDKDLRFYFIYLMNIVHLTVREDSGITKLEELTGKKFHAGMVGAGSTYNTKEILSALNIKPNYFVGSLADAVAAMKDNRIVGYSKAGAGFGAIDATTMDIMTRTKVRILSFTDEQMKIALKARPGLFYGKEPAGTIKGYYKDHPEINSFANGLSLYSRNNVPQEHGYQIMKAIVEHFDEILPTIPKTARMDPVKDTLKYGLQTAEMVGLPLHAGVVQYLQEIGQEVPSILIPPEYKKP
jgi:TRAP transporter TAXI family solute receptor